MAAFRSAGLNGFTRYPYADSRAALANGCVVAERGQKHDRHAIGCVLLVCGLDTVRGADDVDIHHDEVWAIFRECDHCFFGALRQGTHPVTQLL